MAWTAMRVGEWDKAMEYARTGLAKNPCHVCRPYLVGALAMGLKKRGEYDQALPYFELMQSAEPSLQSWGLGHYADIVIEHRPALFEKGFGYAKRAVEIDPKDADNRVTLAKYYLRRNERQEALSQVQAALAIDGEHEDAQALRDEIQKAGP
jgi:tetratricopeptide (TPR) repeat protein